MKLYLLYYSLKLKIDLLNILSATLCTSELSVENSSFDNDILSGRQ